MSLQSFRALDSVRAPNCSNPAPGITSCRRCAHSAPAITLLPSSRCTSELHYCGPRFPCHRSSIAGCPMAASKAAGPRTLTNTIKLLINAGAAKPAPPVGPALGQAGLNIMAFCKEFNAKTANYKEGTPLRVKLRVFSDKTYEWDLKTPPTSWLVKKAAGKLRFKLPNPTHP